MQLVIDAKAIPGFMAAMTMPYTVKDSAAIRDIRAGDQVTADVVVNGGVAWLENVLTGGSAAPAPPPSGPMVDPEAAPRRDSARPPRDSIGIKPPDPDSISRPAPPVDSAIRPYPVQPLP
jgi:hypothetical protein